MKKKFLLPLLAVMIAFTTGRAEESDLSQFTDAVYVQSTEVPRGTQQTLSIQMKNSISVQSFQFNLYLPDGLTVILNEDDELMTASKERIRKFDYFKSSVQNDGSILLLAQATTTNIAVGEGEIATIMVSVDADKDLGDYPISIKNIKLVTKDNEAKSIEEVTTKITVTEFDDHIVFDENSATLPTYTAGEKGNVRMTRTITAGQWSTIVLPFTLNMTKAQTAFGSDVQLAEFSGFETTYENEEEPIPSSITINFTDYTLTTTKSMKGGVPYLIKTSQNISSIEAENCTLFRAVTPVTKSDNYETDGKFTGSLVKTVVPEDGLFINNNKFWYSVGTTKIKAFRCWFELGAVLDKLTDFEVKMNIFVDGELTRINELMPETSDDAIYDLAGRKVEKAEKGIYIVNGKKVLVK